MNLGMALVLQVVAILVIAGSSLGDDDAVLHRKCPLTMVEEEQMHKQIVGFALKCFKTSEEDMTDLDHLKTIEDLKEHQDFFKYYCQKQPQILECLADVALTSQSCQNETRHQIFQNIRELLETALHAGCIQDGEVLVNMIMIYKSNATTAPNLNTYLSCLLNSLAKIEYSYNIAISKLSSFYIAYRNVVQAKECVNLETRGDQHVKDTVVAFLSEIVEKVKCFHPQDDSVVMCKNLDPIDDEPRVCPIKSEDEHEHPLFGLILERLPECFPFIGRSEMPNIRQLESLEEFHLFFKNKCEKRHIITRCFKEVVSLSLSCLDNTHHVIISTYEDMFRNLVEHMCLEDGRYIGDVMFKINSDVANSSEPNAIKMCLSGANPFVEDMDKHLTSQKSVELYEKLQVFRGCVLDKLQGDDVALASAQLISNGVLGNAKCLNPEQTASVLCSTLVNTV